MLAAQLDSTLFDVTIYEKNFAPGRKFLVAGDGGFNLTHSEDLTDFIGRYSPDGFIEPYLQSFTNADFREWLLKIGISTFVGSSKRVFPEKGIKPVQVLNAILDVLKKKKVILKTLHHWQGWNSDGELLFVHKENEIKVNPDLVVFALGGGSWAKTGSDGQWLNLFAEKEINILPFQPSNCAVKVDWNSKFIEVAEGKALKNIEVKCGTKSKAGEIVITRFGLEGGAVYALSPEIRKQLRENGTATLYFDLKPSLSMEKIHAHLSEKGIKSLSKVLKDKLKFGDVQLALLNSILTKEEFISPPTLSERIKNLPILISGLAPLDEAISSVGGIPLDEVDENFELKKLPNHFAIGEMLNWDAPTGGYLLQGCFSMGYFLGKRLNKAL